MEENTTNSNATTNTNTAAAAETAVDSIKKLMESVGNDDALKQKLADALAALTGKEAEGDKSEKQQAETADSKNAGDEDCSADADEDEDEEDEDDEVSSGSDFSDIFNEDAVAGMVVGFVAGAAVVGGGVLLHKLITKD